MFKKKLKNKPKIEVLTNSGWLLDLNKLSIDDITLDDIAHGLSHQARYNGQTEKFYSVAEHSILLSEYVFEQTKDAELALWALLHDASEAYMGDVVRNLKPLLPEFLKLEEEITRLIYYKYNLNTILVVNKNQIIEWDKQICNDELMALAPNYIHKQRLYFSIQDKLLDVKIKAMPSKKAKKKFIKTFMKFWEIDRLW